MRTTVTEQATAGPQHIKLKYNPDNSAPNNPQVDAASNPLIASNRSKIGQPTLSSWFQDIRSMILSLELSPAKCQSVIEPLVRARVLCRDRHYSSARHELSLLLEALTEARRAL